MMGGVVPERDVDSAALYEEERLAFVSRPYQHLLPGMSAAAATRFADLIANAGRWTSTAHPTTKPQVTETGRARAGRRPSPGSGSTVGHLGLEPVE